MLVHSKPAYQAKITALALHVQSRCASGLLSHFALQYIYGALPSQLSVWSTVLLYLAADKYQLGSLLFQCREALALTVSLENCFDVARLADAHSDSDLEQV